MDNWKEFDRDVDFRYSHVSDEYEAVSEGIYNDMEDKEELLDNGVMPHAYASRERIVEEMEKVIDDVYFAVFFTERFLMPEEGGTPVDVCRLASKKVRTITADKADKFEERAQRLIDEWHPENERPLYSVLSLGQYHVRRFNTLEELDRACEPPEPYYYE